MRFLLERLFDQEQSSTVYVRLRREQWGSVINNRCHAERRENAATSMTLKLSNKSKRHVAGGIRAYKDSRPLIQCKFISGLL